MYSDEVLFDFSEIDEESNSKGPASPGKCHLLIVDTEEKDNSLGIISKVVAHEEPSSVGKTVRMYLPKRGRGAKKSQDFLLAVGFVTHSDLLLSQAKGQQVSKPSKQWLVGKSFCAKLEEDEDSDWPTVGWNIFSPTSPASSKYPKSKAHLPSTQEATDQAMADKKIPF